MANIRNIKYKLFVMSLVTFLTITIISTGIIDSAYASHKKVKVGCKDVALALITWAQSIPLVDDDDIAENEHLLSENGIKPSLYKHIVDDHLEDLLDDVDDKCKHLDDDIDDRLDKIKFRLP